MKNRMYQIVFGTLILALVSVSSAAEIQFDQGRIVTKQGKVYTEVKVSKVEPDGIRILHSGGAALIKMEDLPDEIAGKFTFVSKDEAEKLRNERKLADQKVYREGQELRDRSTKSMTTQPTAAPNPQFITSHQVKLFWLNSYPIPQSLDREYRAKIEARSEFIKTVNSGVFDLDADLFAANWNRQQAATIGDTRSAEEYSNRISRIEGLIQRRDAELAQQARDAQEQYRHNEIMRELRDMNGNLQMIDGKLWDIRRKLNR